jgi:O-antigen/teichoic acid export membrane protein
MIGNWRHLVGSSSSLRRELVRGAGGSFALYISSKLLMLIMSMLLARLLGANGYGMYASAMALVLLLNVPAAMGLPTLVIRLFATYRVQQQWSLMRGLFVRANQVVLILTLIIAGIGTLVVWMFSEHFGTVNTSTLWWAMALLPLTALNALRSAGLRGLHHVILGQLPESLIMPGVFLGLVLVWHLMGLDLDPAEAVALRVVATVPAFAIGAYFLFQAMPKQARQAVPHYQSQAWARSAMPLLFLGGMSFINTQTDILMLASISGSESAGIYQAAVRSAEFVAFSLIIVNVAIQPTLSRLYASGDLERLQRVITASARVALLLALPVALVMVVFAKPIMVMVFGQEFKAGANCLIILSSAQVINAAMGSVGQILNMTGYEKDAAQGMAIGAIANVLLNAILIPVWDMTGAAVATGTSLIIWNLVLAIKVRQRLGLMPSAIGKIRIHKSVADA